MMAMLDLLWLLLGTTDVVFKIELGQDTEQFEFSLEQEGAVCSNVKLQKLASLQWTTLG